MAYKILFIDEQKDSHDDFQEYIDFINEHEDNDEMKFEVIASYPERTLDEMVDYTNEEAPDVLITDFRLNEYKTDISYNVLYNGAELVEKYRQLRADFPCFIMTSHDDEAIDKSIDVNLVYVKDLMAQEMNTEFNFVSFSVKIQKQINKYRRKIEGWEKDYISLLEKRRSDSANFPEESRLIELDSLLENAIDSHKRLPRELKETKLQSKLAELISKADEILDKYGSD